MAESTEKLKQHMKTAVAAVLKTMASIDVDALDGPPAGGLQTASWVKLWVHQPIEGVFILHLPRELTKNIAMAMFKVSHSAITEPLVDDAMAELLNTIAGRIMASILSKNQDFTLGLPEHGSGKNPMADTASIVLYFSAEGESICLRAEGQALRQFSIPV